MAAVTPALMGFSRVPISLFAAIFSHQDRTALPDAHHASMNRIPLILLGVGYEILLNLVADVMAREFRVPRISVFSDLTRGVSTMGGRGGYTPSAVGIFRVGNSGSDVKVRENPLLETLKLACPPRR